MGSDLPDQFPSSFDPAIFLHSEIGLPISSQPDPSFSDDLAGLHAVVEEARAENNRKGIVVQHRAWRLAEVFRSEEDCPIRTPSKPNRRSTQLVAENTTSSFGENRSSLRSSPPLELSDMAATATSPASSTSQRKRRKVDDQRSPLKTITNNARTVTGFVDEDSDSDDGGADYFHKTSNSAGKAPQFGNSIEDLDNILDAARDEPQEEPQSPEHVPTEPEKPSSFTYQPHGSVAVRLFSGQETFIRQRKTEARIAYERIIAARSTTAEGRAARAFYGIDIHDLLQEVEKEKVASEAAKQVQEAVKLVATIESAEPKSEKQSKMASRLWTEKYRARKFTDLVGDERTHRSVLHWLKSWDSIVFPGSVRKGPKRVDRPDNDEVKHRKILLLTGPPGLGKTTLAHVCARQSGYEVQEINASDERSRDIVKGRIRDMVGTENVRGISQDSSNGKKIRKAGKPVCVVVDEVDGVVGGSGAGGDGGFVKALIDLILLDQKNSNTPFGSSDAPKRKKKGDRFRLLRPLILICNDLYHPSLRPLRQSSLAEIVYVRKPPLPMVVSRMHSIFEKEGITCDLDGVRRLCEATWGVGSKKELFSSGTVEGDIRSVLVVGEWVASRYRSSCLLGSDVRVSKAWIEQNILAEVSYGGGAARSLGRGGAREVVDRVFQEGAGFPKTADTSLAKVVENGVVGVAETAKRRAVGRLREMIDASGEHEKIITDCFSSYPEKPIQDDNFLTKPNAAYEWLHFHDFLSSQIFHSQDWELAPYMSSSILAFHTLFASSMPRHAHAGADTRHFSKDDSETAAPFSGSSAPYQASEALKVNNAAIAALQSNLSLTLGRMYRSRESIAQELLPYILRLLAPDVKPVVINVSSGNGNRSAPTASVRRAEEKEKVGRAVDCMAATGVRFDKSRVEDDRRASGGWVYRMEPGLDALGTFETMKAKADGVRYAVRQVLEGEWHRRAGKKAQVSGLVEVSEKKTKERHQVEKDQVKDKKMVRRDFFGRAVAEPTEGSAQYDKEKKAAARSDSGRVWVSYHDGYSNAVRRPITLEELMRGL